MYTDRSCSQPATETAVWVWVVRLKLSEHIFAEVVARRKRKSSLCKCLAAAFPGLQQIASRCAEQYIDRQTGGQVRSLCRVERAVGCVETTAPRERPAVRLITCAKRGAVVECSMGGVHRCI